MLATVGEGQWIYALVIYVITAVAFNGSSIYYDAFLTDVTTDERMDEISSKGFGFGYLGGTIPFIISLGIILSAERLGLTVTLADPDGLSHHGRMVDDLHDSYAEECETEVLY